MPLASAPSACSPVRSFWHPIHRRSPLGNRPCREFREAHSEYISLLNPNKNPRNLKKHSVMGFETQPTARLRMSNTANLRMDEKVGNSECLETFLHAGFISILLIILPSWWFQGSFDFVAWCLALHSSCRLIGGLFRHHPVTKWEDMRWRASWHRMTWASSMGAMSPLIAVTCGKSKAVLLLCHCRLPKLSNILQTQGVAAVLQCVQFGNHFLVRMPLWASC